MSLVDNHRTFASWQHTGPVLAALFGQANQLPGDKRKLLQRADDDRDAVLQRLGQLPGIVVDLLNDSLPVIELIDRVLQLVVEDQSIRDDNHTVEHPLIPLVMQRRQPVSQPADRVALSAAGRVLNEIVVSDTFRARRIDQASHRLQLMVARKDHRLFSHLAAIVSTPFFDLQVQEPGQQVKQAVAVEHLVPQVSRAVSSLFVGRVARPVVVPAIERQEVRRRTGQARRHEHEVGVGGEMDQRPAFELEDDLARIAIRLVLTDRILNRLARQVVLEFQRHHRNAVDAQDHVQ